MLKVFKALSALLLGIVLFTIMAFIFDVWCIEKLHGNNFHTGKMRMELFLHEKDLWKITLKELLLLKIEFWKIVLKKGIFEHCLFMKKDKLAHETIFLNVNFMLHHLAHAKFAKDSWNNLCATFEKKNVDNKLQLCQKLYNLMMEEGTLMQIRIDKLWMIVS